MVSNLKLGVNLDHVATLRQVRYAEMLGSLNAEPSLLKSAELAKKSGADSITVHLREDRRHIQDNDVIALRKEIDLPLNLEMSLADEIVEFAIKVKPDYVCLVPERREELTTEGGLDVEKNFANLEKKIPQLQKNSKVSIFIDPDERQVELSSKVKADMIELHTGAFANNFYDEAKMNSELERLKNSATLAHKLNLQVNAGHGLNLDNLQSLLQVPHLSELNIGHHIVTNALFLGLEQSIKIVKTIMANYNKKKM